MGDRVKEKLSAVVIVQNEEENLPGCLESLAFADEIIVCDGGSTDATVEIAEKSGARVVHRHFDGFSNQKNFVIDQAEGPWILSLDADERITPELRSEIIVLLASSEIQTDGFNMPRKGYFGDRWIKHGGWWPDYNLRLFRKDKGRFVDREVHECVKVDGSVEKMSGAIVHLTYRDTSDYLKRMERYSTLAAVQADREGKKALWIDIVLRPLFTFFRMYVLRRGFLDGYIGFKLAVLYAVYTFAKYAKLREIQG